MRSVLSFRLTIFRSLIGAADTSNAELFGSGAAGIRRRPFISPFASLITMFLPLNAQILSWLGSSETAARVGVPAIS